MLYFCCKQIWILYYLTTTKTVKKIFLLAPS
uniref:Uncharacterized protein n=1 Tax=Anguilla anguilla TaxID=7936 RepID=A0A0E9XMM6_ANGAN